MKNPIVIILTGPCGAGKTTIARQCLHYIDAEYISGDEIAKRLFPEVSYITKHPEKLKRVKDEIFELSKRYFHDQGQTVLLDYVILGEAYIAKFKETFQSNLIIKVLLPAREVIYRRDMERDCWQSGRAMIDLLYDKYLVLRNTIGTENYLDNGKQTVEETVNQLVQEILSTPTR